ncbi:MAG: efflux RND transporter periplasmic adaptor subunit [bacterium]|nr:MAG: efflux RND transporter periplasmic adaptor subunit [bacterium]
MKRVTKVFAFAFYIAISILICAAAVLYFGKMDETVEGFGMVSPGRQVGVAPRINGIVEEVFVIEGEKVARNDTLFTIYSEEIELEVKRAGNILANARSELRRAEDEYRNLTTSKSYELGMILADLNEAEQRMKFNEENLERVTKLFDKELVNAEEYERAKLGYESSKSYYEILKSRNQILKKQLERQIEEKRRNLELAESSFALSKKKLDETVVLAPGEGTVLTAAPENLVGTMVGKGKPVMEIGFFDTVIFSADIGETDITDVQRGQDAKIFLNSYPHREYKVFEGRVGRIASVPMVSRGQSTFEVEIAIEEPWVEEENGDRTFLKYGLTGRTEIVVKPEVRLYRLIMDGLSR